MKHEEGNKEEIKLIDGDKWKFEFRPNGYIKVFKIQDTTTKDEARKGKKSFKWYQHFHGVGLDSCMQYIFKYYNGKCGVLVYEDLKNMPN